MSDTLDGEPAPGRGGELNAARPARRPSRAAGWLVLLALTFLAAHAAEMFRKPAGQDEDWYAVPGITILRGGVPRIPYIPSRDPKSACYYADVALYALPPLGFYLQAPVHALVGPGLGAARLASTLAGLAATILVYDLARVWLADRRDALFAATAFVYSRAFLFPATTARTDMAAVAFGLLAVRYAVRDRASPRWWRPAASGAAVGLSLLTHPFGVVPAAHAGVVFLTGAGGWPRRLRAALACAGAASAVFALWLVLIALHPDLFRHQFGNNVLHRAGPGLGRTLLAPWGMLVHQTRQFAGFVGPLQAGLYGLGLAWCLAGARHDPGRRALGAHVALGLVLLAVSAGRHPTLGYYAYPAAFLSVAAGGLCAAVAARVDRLAAPLGTAGRWVGGAAVTALLLLTLLPGAGLRAGAAHVRHWNDPTYNAHAVARAVMADLTPGSVVAVDGEYVLDFYLAGRRVVDATINPLSYDCRTQPYEFAVLGPIGLELYGPLMNDLVRMKSYGSRHDPFAAYAELFRRQPADGPGKDARP